MPDGFNTLGVNDWAAPALPNLGVNDWQHAAPPPPPEPPPPPPPPPSGTLAGMGKAAEQLPSDIIGGLVKAGGAVVQAGGTALQGAARNAESFTRQQIGLINRVDGGQDVPAMDDPLGYADASAEQRAEIRKGIEASVDSNHSWRDSGIGQAGAAVKSAGQSVMDAGGRVQAWGEAAFPMTDEEKARFSTQSVKMIGSLVPYLAAGVVGGMPAVVGLAGVQGFGDHYEAAKKAGASDEDAAVDGTFGALANGALMTVPIAKAMEVAAAVPKAFKGEFLKTLWKMAESGVTMTGFGQLQAVANNVIAKETYAPDQSITKGVGENLGPQFVAGAILPGVGAAMGAAGRLVQRPNVQPRPVSVAPDPTVLQAPDVDSAINAAKQAAGEPATTPGTPVDGEPATTPGTPVDVRSEIDDLETGHSPDLQQAQLLRMFDNTGAGTVEQTPAGGYQFRTTNAAGTEITHPIDVWNPYTEPDASAIPTDTVDALRTHYGQAGVNVVFYKDDGATIPFQGSHDPSQPDTIFLSNNPSQNIAQVATHEFTHILSATTLPDGSSLGDLLNQQIAAGITPAGQHYAATRFGSTAPKRAAFPQGDVGDAAHADAVTAHLINEMGAEIGGEAPKFQSFLPRVVDAIQQRFGNNVAGDVLGKLIDGLKSAMETVRGLFGAEGTRSQNWVSNIGEIHDTLAKMYAAKFGTPVEREQAALATMRDRAARDRFVAEPTADQVAEPPAASDEPGKISPLVNVPADKAADTSDAAASAITWPQTRDATAAKSLQLRRWLDQLAAERDAAAASSPKATILKQTEAAILRPVEGDATRLGDAGKARLDQVRNQIDETTHPTADTPQMAKVRDELKAAAARKDAADAAYVTTSEGSPDLGRIDETMAAAIGSDPAPIRLTHGIEAHIGLRQSELEGHGYANPADFVRDVAAHFREIWSAGGDSLLLVERLQTARKEYAPSLYVLLRRSADGNAYEVQSGGVFRAGYPRGAGRKLLWRDLRDHTTDSDSRMPIANPPGDEAGTGDASARDQSATSMGAPNTEGNAPGGTPDVRQANAARPLESTPGTVPPSIERPADYGANNTTFTADAAERARARLREKLGRLNAGFDPEMMLDGLTLAGFHIEAGARTFAEYSKRMIEDIGDGVRPFLAHFYHSVREYPGFDAAGMDDRGKVDAELKRAADAPQETADDVRPEPGGLDQPGGGEAEPGGGRSGQPEGGQNAGGVETRPPADVPGAGEPGAEAGVRAGPEALPSDETVHPGGLATDGRGGTGDQGVVPAGTGGPRDPVPTAVRPNFHIDDPERLIGGTPKVRFTRNRAAIEALRAIEEEQRAPTPEELQSLAGYIGWGSFGQDLFQGTFERQPPRQGWDAEAKWLRDHLGKDAWESAQRSIINAHYTDPPTVKIMWDMVQRMGFKGGRVLEPSMGIGNFFGMMPRDIMANSTLTGIELDRLSARMAKLLYPQAGIHQKGYQESRTPDNFYDLVIGNWPFAAQSPADRRYDRLSPTLHDYFFLKALDQTRPGGLVVGITSAGTMDKAGRSARIELAKKGELLGAFRLPLGAFEKYAGTSVVTDILVFRKRTEPATNVLDEPWINASDMATPSGQPIRVNDYFKANPDAVLGTLDFGRSTVGRQAMTVHRPADFVDRLASLPDRLPKDGFNPAVRGSEPRFITNNSADRQNSITIGDDGKLYQVQGERMMLLEDVAKQMRAGGPGVSSRNAGKAQKALVKQVETLVGMRRAYGALIDAERDGRPETEDIRQALARQYEAFARDHGPLADSPGLKVLNRLEDPAYGALAALERPDGTPSRILSEPTIRSRRSLDNPTISDAYVIARNETANLDMDRIAELARQPRAAVEHELLSSGAVMRAPGNAFEAADVYLSGNVRRKLREAQDALAQGEDMQASVDALAKALPPTVPYYQIEAKFGAPWAGDATYKQFLGDILGLQGEALDAVHVRFAGSRWRVSFGNPRLNYTPEAIQAGHEDYRFDKLVQAAMGNNVVRIMKRDDKGDRYLDTKATEEVNAKAQALRERFQDWAWADAERKVRLEGAYNETMNAIAKPRYNGGFMDLSGMALRRGNDPFSLREHQMNAIWRGVVTGRGLFAHEVGTGKSYTMGGIAVEGRRYGVFRKPLVLAHNANSAAVGREFSDMYPGGKFLYIDNLAPDVINTTLHRIANEDWDAVIMPHSLIDRMTLSRETLMELAADQVTDLENEAMEAAKEDGVGLTPEMMDDPEAMKKVRSVTAKQLVKQREAIIANIDKQANRGSREGAVAFEKLGVDAIIVDEAHEFKKPPIATRMQLKGLNTAASDRSIALNFLTGYVNKQNNGRGTFLFTGTPVTNALNEIYNMSRYFMGDRMAQDGVKDWDAWFNTFADGVSDVELTAGGLYEPVKRLSAFVNVDELVRTMSEFTDVVQAKDMPEFVPRATPDGKTMASPDLTPEGRDFLQNGRTEKPVGRPYKKILTDVAEMSPDQKAILDNLQARWKAFKEAKGQAKRDLLMQGEGLKIGNGLRAASLDARMHDPEAPDDPTSKVNRVAANVLKHYQEERAGQAIFVDQGYNAAKTSEGRAERFVLMQDLVDKLVDGGIPRKEIAIVAGGVSAEKKKATADAMNAGTIRVVIGQSSTLGVGVNMQTNLRAMHHMDAPWRPGDLEQRNGRGERQGNEWNTVLEYRYVTEGIDGRGWQILTTKDRFIKQFISAFNDESGKRIGNIEGDAADISENEDILQTLGQAAGDPRIMLRAKYQADVTRLERRERMHTLGQADAAQRARQMRQQFADQQVSNARDATRLQTWDAAAARMEEAAKAAGDTRRWYEADIGGQKLRTGPDIQKALDEQVVGLARGDDKVIATINGHDVVARWRSADPLYMIAGSLIDAPTMPRITGAMTALRNRVSAASKPGRFEESVLRLEAAADEDFPRRPELARKRQQLANLEDDLQANPVPPPAWLRHGAPLDSEIYVDGQARTVRGHRMTNDYKLVTDEGEVSYRRAKDENGNQIYEVHPPPDGAQVSDDARPGSQIYDLDARRNAAIEQTTNSGTDSAPPDSGTTRDGKMGADQNDVNLDIGEARPNPSDQGGTQFSPRIAVSGHERETQRWTPAELQAYTNVGRVVETPTWRERIAEAKQDLGRRFIRATLDPYIGVKANDPAGYMALRNANTSAGATEMFLTDGTLKFSGSTYAMADRNGGVEHSLIRPLHGEQDRFLWWVAANRAERLSAEDRENLWSRDDIDTIKGTNQGQVAFDYQLPNGQVTRSREAIYLDSLRKLDGFNKNVLDLAVEAGLLDRDKVSALFSNPFYVPFYRIAEGDTHFAGPSLSSGFVKQNAFKALKGGTAKLNHDLWQNAIGNWSHMIDASLRNKAASGVLDVGVTNGAVIERTQLQVDHQMTKAERQSVVWVMNNGQKQNFQVADPMLYTAISALDFGGYRNPIMNAASKFKQLLTLGVTADPRFMLRTAIRDAEQAIAAAPMSYNMLGNVVQGFKMGDLPGALKNVARAVAGQELRRLDLSDEAADAIAGGGTMRLGSGHDTGGRTTDLATMLDNPTSIGAFWQRISTIARAYKEVSAQSEDSQRFALYHKLIAEGVPHDQASFAARDLEDFTLKGAGAIARTLTQTVPFLNAWAQGLYKVGRSAFDQDRNFAVPVGQRLAASTTRRVATVLGMTTMLTLALDAIYADDEDYKKRPEYDRNSNYWFKFGGVQFRIPMGFEVAALSRIAANGVEAFFGLNEMTGRRFLNNVGSIVGTNMSMSPVPQVVRPVLDLMENQTATGSPIVTQGMDKLRSEEQYNAGSTLLARGVSTVGNSAMRAIGGPQARFLAPVQVDHLVDGYFGWLGTQVIGTADKLVRAIDQGQAAARGVQPLEPARPGRDIWNAATGGMISTMTTPQSRYVDMLYQQADAVNRAFATYHELIARGRIDDAREFYADNKDQIGKHQLLAKVSQVESMANRQIKRVGESRTLSAEQKQVQVMKYNAMRNRAAENVFGR